MRRSFFMLLFFLFISTTCSIFRKSPEIKWQKMIGGSGEDSAYSIKETSDMCYVAAGLSYSKDIRGLTNHGKADYYIVKINRKGYPVWQKMIGGIGNDIAYSIDITADGGYIIAGSSFSRDIPGVQNNGKMDCYIVKLDSSGKIVWQKMIGGTGYDHAGSIIEIPDEGYIIAGSSASNDINDIINYGSSDFYIVKLDLLGNIIWQKMIGGFKSDSANSINYTADGGYIISGYSYSSDIPGIKNNGICDFYIIKLNYSGDIVWQKMIGGSDNDSAFSVHQTADKGYIIAGNSASTDIPDTENNGSYDCCILKLDSSGKTVWQKMIGGFQYDHVYSILETANRNYIAAGVTASSDINGTDFNLAEYCYIFKINSKGKIIWQKTFGNKTGKINSIEKTKDNGFITAGKSNASNIPNVYNKGKNDFYIVKLK